MKEKGFAYVDQGALVVDVKEDNDTKEIPPCMLLKSDGASLYTTTDLATIVERMKLFNPDEILYVVDKRQELHFIQVFRCARKTGLVNDDTKLSFLGFGTMNGKDGKPFKTREGGVMRLETLIKDINEEMFNKIVENRSVKDKDARETAEIVGLSAIKYGDLSNQATKDYIFDIDRFTSFEGNTGPYILYTIVRIKSILNRFVEEGGDLDAGVILDPVNDSQKNLMLQLVGFGATVENAFEEKAPHKICAYIYEVSNAFNSFYHETKILSEENEAQKASFHPAAETHKESSGDMHRSSRILCTGQNVKRYQSIKIKQIFESALKTETLEDSIQILYCPLFVTVHWYIPRGVLYERRSRNPNIRANYAIANSCIASVA